MAITEAYLQYKLCEWMREREIIHFHVPNGGTRDKREGARLKAMGTLAGVHDLIILLDEGRTIFVELKTGGGKQSPAQKAFDEKITRIGHRTHLVHADSAEEGIGKLESILLRYNQ